MVEERVRSCVTGADPEKRFPVPIDGQFDGDEFKDAPELKAVAERLIEDADELGDLAAYPPMIRYMWRQKAQKSKGAAMFGNCKKVSGLTKHFGQTEWVMEIAADLLREMKASNFQVEALIFHELKHIKVTVDEETGEASHSYVREEYSAFGDEIRRYGAWHGELEKVGEAFAQAPLFARGKPRKGGDGVTATLSGNGRTVDLDDEAGVREVVGAALDGALRRAATAARVNLVTADS